MSPAAVETTSAPECISTGDDLRAWVWRHMVGGSPVAILGDHREIEPLGRRITRLNVFPPLLWGKPDPAALAEILLRAMSVPHAEAWRQPLELALGALQAIAPSHLELLPRIVRDPQARRTIARRLGDTGLGATWRAADWGTQMAGDALAEALAHLLHGAPDLVYLGAGRSPAPARAYLLPRSSPNPSLVGALFVTCVAGLARDGAPTAVVARLPVEAETGSDLALRWALSRLHGEVLDLSQHELSSPAPGSEDKKLAAEARSHAVWRPREGAAAPSLRALPHAPPWEPRAGRLFLEATSPERLAQGWAAVRERRGTPGVDRVGVKDFEINAEAALDALSADLRKGRYRPVPLLRLWVDKSGGEKRALGVPAVRDRVAQAAMLQTLVPLYERVFLDCSFGYRERRNAHQAISWVEGLRDEGFTWVVTSDIRRCFDSLDHELLFRLLGRRISDPDVMALLRAWVTVPVWEDGVISGSGRVGIPQGSPISPLLANAYLHPLDLAMSQTGLPWVRYADDTLCMAPSREEALRGYEALQRHVTALRLTLKDSKSGIASFDEGLDFLGFHFHGRDKEIALGNRLEFRRRLLQVLVVAHVHRDERLQRARKLITGFGAYFRSAEARVTEQLAELDAWAQRALQRFLSPSKAELGKVGSLLVPPPIPLACERDFYSTLLIDSPPVEAPAGTPAAPAPVGVPATATPSAKETPRPAQGDTDGATPADGEPVTAPRADEVDLSTPDRLKALFLDEGYGKEDLREFLRLAPSGDQPELHDGTLYVTGHGSALGKASAHLVVRRGGLDLGHAALRDLRQVVIQAVGVTLSSTLVRELAQRGVPVHFLDWKGMPFAEVRAPSRESPTILRGQLRAYEGPAGVAIAKEMLSAKGANQAQLLRLYARYRDKREPEVARQLNRAIATMERNVAAFDDVEGPSVEVVRGQLLAVEGRIAAAHFRAIAALLGPDVGFSARARHNESHDVANSMLDYFYGMLYVTCHRALVAAGLDPRLGFVHTDGPDGKLSLLYDFIEEFRAIAADRPALALLTRGSAVTRTRSGRLTLPTRRRLLRAYTRNLAARCRHRTERRPLGEIIERQAKHLAEVLGARRMGRYRAFRYNH